MRQRRKKQANQFSQFLVSLMISSGLLLALSINIAACARTDVGELATRKPNFALEEFFAGNSVAFGIFEDRFGNLRRQFRVNLSGKVDGNRLVLNEEFLYDDGERATRVWTIDRGGLDAAGLMTFQGQADDVKLAARGVQAGNALNWQYDISLEMSGTNVDVHFDDWIYKQDEDVAINRAFVTKFGVEIGSVTIVFIRGKTASNLWPLSLDEWPSR